MALSETVKESLRDAQEDLRNALACAARTEKPFVSKHIADMLAQIDNLIDATQKTSTTATTPCVVSDATIADDAEITVDIDQIGSSTAGKGLKLTLYYTVTE